MGYFCCLLCIKIIITLSSFLNFGSCPSPFPPFTPHCSFSVIGATQTGWELEESSLPSPSCLLLPYVVGFQVSTLLVTLESSFLCIPPSTAKCRTLLFLIWIIASYLIWFFLLPVPKFVTVTSILLAATIAFILKCRSDHASALLKILQWFSIDITCTVFFPSFPQL